MTLAFIFCMKTPTRQPPSSAMPSFLAGVLPAKVQLNMVPLYLPATISPAPAQEPSLGWKKARSRAPAAGGWARPAASAAGAARGQTLGRGAGRVRVHPD